MLVLVLLLDVVVEAFIERQEDWRLFFIIDACFHHCIAVHIMFPYFFQDPIFLSQVVAALRYSSFVLHEEGYLGFIPLYHPCPLPLSYQFPIEQRVLGSPEHMTHVIKWQSCSILADCLGTSNSCWHQFYCFTLHLSQGLVIHTSGINPHKVVWRYIRQ